MRPKVICHIMTSVDGRLLPDRWSDPIENVSKMDCLKSYSALSSSMGTDAWMFGKGTTIEQFPYKFMPKKSTDYQGEKIYVGDRKSRRFFITVDPDANIFFTHNQFRGDNILVVLGRNATIDYLEMLEEKAISYIVLENAYDLKRALELISEHFGVKYISLQGGGVIDGAMLAEGLIDELSLVIYPGIYGKSDVPSIFEYIGNKEKPAEGQSLELTTAKQLDNGVMWLRYKFHKD